MANWRLPVQTQEPIRVENKAYRPYRKVFSQAVAAGQLANMNLICPQGKAWEIESIWLRLGTDANVADRQPALYINSRGTIPTFTGIGYYPTMTPQVANSVGFFTWSRGIGDVATKWGNSTVEAHAIPDIILRYGQGLQIVNNGEQAGDNYIVNMLYEEFDDNGN